MKVEKQNHVLTAACKGVDNRDKQSDSLSFFRLEMKITTQLNAQKSHIYIYIQICYTFDKILSNST